MSDIVPKKIGENQYQIDADSNLGMKVPVRIYADEPLMQKMLSDRTIMQARNVASIPGIDETFRACKIVLSDNIFCNSSSSA